MLVAPSEPKTMKVLGRSSSVPETMGADVLIPHAGSMIGVQRKEISDLIASVQDGRLAKELAQLQRCSRAVLIVEGRLKWSTDGVLMDRQYGRDWTRTTHRNLLRSVQSRGVWVESTDDTADTVVCILELAEYLKKPAHNGLLKRSGMPVAPWGKADNRDWSAHLLQSFDGVGPELAGRVVDHFGGRAPLQWTVGEKELQEVAGIGPRKAKQMIGALA